MFGSILVNLLTKSASLLLYRTTTCDAVFARKSVQLLCAMIVIGIFSVQDVFKNFTMNSASPTDQDV